MLSIHFNHDCHPADVHAAIDSFALRLESGPLFTQPLLNARLRMIPSNFQVGPGVIQLHNTPTDEHGGLIINPSVHLVHLGPGTRHPFFVEFPMRLEVILHGWRNVPKPPDVHHEASFERIVWTWSQAFDPGQEYFDVTPVLMSSTREAR